MKIDSPAPFEEFTCYKVFHRKMGRWQVCLKHRETGESTTMLYSKFVMSAAVGRRLLPSEEVDHVNGDKTDDRIENLEIVTRRENRKRQAALAAKRSLITLVCPYCSRQFQRPIRTTHFRKGSVRTFCSRSCSVGFNSRKDQRAFA